MKSVIPFTKELEFDTKVSEITSISLEREFTVLDESIEGNLLITGEYKSHEVSVNVIPFSFKIPFSIAITSNVLTDSISLEISDFAYDNLDENKIKVHVELELDFAEKEEIKEDLKEIDESEKIIEMLEEEGQKEKEEDVREIADEIILEPKVNVEEKEVIPEPIIDEGDQTMPIEEKTVLETEAKDEYMTYHIHILKDGETLETLCSMYHVTGSFLAEYNDISALKVGDKILIPLENE